jgi:hypothetical protein
VSGSPGGARLVLSPCFDRALVKACLWNPFRERSFSEFEAERLGRHRPGSRSRKVQSAPENASGSLPGVFPAPGAGDHGEDRKLTANGAHGVVVSHPLSMREALGSIPSVSMTFVPQKNGFRAKHSQKDRLWDLFLTFPPLEGRRTEPLWLFRGRAGAPGGRRAEKRINKFHPTRQMAQWY